MCIRDRPRPAKKPAAKNLAATPPPAKRARQTRKQANQGEVEDQNAIPLPPNEDEELGPLGAGDDHDDPSSASRVESQDAACLAGVAGAEAEGQTEPTPTQAFACANDTQDVAVAQAPCAPVKKVVAMPTVRPSLPPVRPACESRFDVSGV